jgi:hypothetical protein
MQELMVRPGLEQKNPEEKRNSILGRLPCGTNYGEASAAKNKVFR